MFVRKFFSLLYHPKTQFVIRFLVHFLKDAPLHGLSHLARQDINFLEFLFWICSVVIWIAVAFKCCAHVSYDYLNWTSTLILRENFLHFDTALPAFTFCPHKVFDERKAQQYLEGLSVPVKEQLKILRLLEELSERTIFSDKLFNEHDFPSWINTTVYMELVFNFSIRYDIVTKNGEHAVPIFTELGVCYTFNNVLIDAINTANWGDHIRSNLSLNLENPVKVSNRNLFPIIKEFILENTSGTFDFYLHAPYELPTIWTRKAAIFNASNFEKWYISVHLNEIIPGTTSNSDVERRKCRTSYESNLKMFPSIYARSLCLTECRASYAIKFCGCIPHFYALKAKNRHISSAPICTTLGLNCLSSYGLIFKKLARNSELSFQCNCLPLCGDLIIKFKVKRILSNQEHNEIKCLMNQAPIYSLQRLPLFSEVDLAVSFGNFLSVFFGFNLLAGVEMIYFFTLRLFWYRRGYLGDF